MSAPLDGLVLFTLNVSFAQHHDGHWRAITSETGVVTYGATETDAEHANRLANLALVRSWKRRGAEALDRFMLSHGIAYRVVDDERTSDPGTQEQWSGRGVLPLAA